MFHTHETKMLCGDCHGAEGKDKTADIRKVRIRMRKYKSDQTLDRVICNGCGRKLVVEDGILREGAFSAEYSWDYFSEKDGEIHRWDLCEECYDRMTGQFRIRPDVEELVEFI